MFLHFEMCVCFSVQDMLKSRGTLPIAELKGDILRLLKENNVLVVCGETGCGKTTQVQNLIYFHHLLQILFILLIILDVSVLFLKDLKRKLHHLSLIFSNVLEINTSQILTGGYAGSTIYIG